MNYGLARFRLFVSLLLGFVLWAGISYPASAQLGSADVQQLCAPIALYPDPLLSNVLAASTYPDEVVAAARWSQRVGPIAPSAINSTLAGQGWDPAVKSLVAFPSVLNYMSSNMAWTVALGNAFLAQGPDVFDAIQSLRLQAQSSGNLGSGSQQLVSNVDGAIIIEPANPNMIYVPTYNSNQVYYQPQPAGLALAFGLGILIDRFLWTGVPDWNQNRLYFGQGYNSYYRGSGNYNNNYYNNVRTNIGNNQGAWRFNSQHRGARAVPTRAQLNPGRGYGDYRLSPKPAVNQPGYSRPTNNQRPAVQVPAGLQRPTYQGQTKNNSRPVAQPQVRTAPANRPTSTVNVPSGFNVRPGARVNQESTRGAQSRNQNRPTQVAPVARPSQPNQTRTAPGQSGKKGERK